MVFLLSILMAPLQTLSVPFFCKFTLTDRTLCSVGLNWPAIRNVSDEVLERLPQQILSCCAPMNRGLSSILQADS